MLGIGIQLELNEDNHVFSDGAKRTNEPGKIGHYVFALYGMAKNAETVCEVTHQ